MYMSSIDIPNKYNLIGNWIYVFGTQFRIRIRNFEDKFKMTSGSRCVKKEYGSETPSLSLSTNWFNWSTCLGGAA